MVTILVWVVLGEVGEVRVGGRGSVGRPRKEWSECVIEDMSLLGLKKHVAEDQWMWKATVAWLGKYGQKVIKMIMMSHNFPDPI